MVGEQDLLCKGERILQRVQDEYGHVQAADLNRKRYLVSLLHLAITYLEDEEPDLRRTIAHKITVLLRQLYASVETGPLSESTRSELPLSYFVSYPRSGNTLVTRLTAVALQGQVLSAMQGARGQFSKKLYPESYPYPRIVKDHVAHAHYANDKCIFIVRDGRDTIVSLAHMTYKLGLHKFKKQDEIADFIKWSGESYLFGDWPTHIRSVLSLAQYEQKKIVRYENFLKNSDEFVGVVDYFDENNCFSETYKRDVYSTQDRVFENIENKPVANATWGIGHKFEPDDMFFHWSKNRKGSSWALSWNKAAKKAFHDIGGTEALMELGYESDPNWWAN